MFLPLFLFSFFLLSFVDSDRDCTGQDIPPLCIVCPQAKMAVLRAALAVSRSYGRTRESRTKMASSHWLVSPLSQLSSRRSGQVRRTVARALASSLPRKLLVRVLLGVAGAWECRFRRGAKKDFYYGSRRRMGTLYLAISPRVGS
ncbi:hypothetical protein GGS23DRAFT_460474 [Durotheca rogersii]|uniref:uncharacterized protein n=1 Tax=Durotheca rogersii TaxID=419775 RepID=UPI00221FEF08|nr:uncharacterized protein GGS23DRAFT_460474 [Durotheca rogersii]KAI5864726.1 hypothetical protein GGS23DRAFT_460474 [Durotheca rogersii]